MWTYCRRDCRSTFAAEATRLNCAGQVVTVVKTRQLGFEQTAHLWRSPFLGLGLRPPCSSGLRSSCLNRTFPFRSEGREGSESAHSSIRVVIDFPAMPCRWTCGYVRPEAKGLTAVVLEEPIVSLNQAPKRALPPMLATQLSFVGVVRFEPPVILDR